MIGWPSVLGGSLLGLLTLWGPGVLVFRTARAPWVVAVASGPLATAGLASLAAVIAPVLGLHWSWTVFLGAVALASGVAWLVRAVPETDVAPRSGAHPLPGWPVLAIVGTAALLPVLAAVVIPGSRPLQQIDPTFHMNALRLIEDTGNASSFGGLTRMYGLETSETTYPAGWHALASLLVPVAGVVGATNALGVVTHVVWIVGMGALAWWLWRDGRAVNVVALLPLVVVVPTFLLTRYPVLPNALGAALLPGAAVLWWWAIPRVRRVAVVAGLTLAGSLVHPSLLLGVVLLMVVPVLAALWRRWRAPDHRTRRNLEVAVLTAAGALTALVVLAVPGLRSRLGAMLTNYATEPSSVLVAIPRATTLLPFLDDPLSNAALAAAQAVIFALTALGVVQVVRRREYLLLAMWLPALAVTITTMARVGPLVPIAGLWYMNPHRVMAVQAIPQLLLMGLGLGVIVRAMAGRAAPIAAAALASVAISAPTVLHLHRFAYEPGKEDINHVASPEELAMIRSLEELLPDDAVLLGDPSTGAALAWAVSDVEVVFPQVYVREGERAEDLLRQEFGSFSPEVCDVLDEHSITHFYSDTDATNFGRDSRETAPGLHDVDESRLDLVARGGTAAVWRITGCD